MGGAVNTRGRVAIGAAVIAAGLALYLVLGGGSGHRFTTVVPSAGSLVPGSQVKGPGGTIGKVDEVSVVDGGHAAKLTLEIDDANYWPLAKDTRLEIRLGGTVSFSNRYVFLTPGQATGAGNQIPDGGQLASSNVTVPVEPDTFTSYFDKATRGDFRRLVRNSAGVLERGSAPLHQALIKAPPVVENG